MKARLYRGPFNGKVVDCDGRTEIYIRGPKRMSRKARYEAEAEWFRTSNYPYSRYRPQEVEAVYRICTDHYPSPVALVPPNTPISSVQVVTSVLRHPDGSIFYEFVRSRELPMRP